VDSKKIFDEPVVECNECEHYWDSSCDGTPLKQERSCTSYKATRREDIPGQIKKLKYNIDKLYLIMLIMNVTLILHLLGHIFWG
jgi:hypothetical protein